MLNAESVRKMYQGNIIVTNENTLCATRYNKYSNLDRLKIAKEAVATTVIEAAKKYKVKDSTIYAWIKKAELINENTNKRYSDVEKRAIVEYSYKHSLVKAKEKFGAAQQTICNWRKDYSV